MWTILYHEKFAYYENYCGINIALGVMPITRQPGRSHVVRHQRPHLPLGLATGSAGSSSKIISDRPDQAVRDTHGRSPGATWFPGLCVENNDTKDHLES